MWQNMLAFAVALVVSLGVALIVYAVLRKSLCALLEETIRIPAGAVFYSRLLLIGLLFLALYAVLATKYALDAGGAAFMEYVWKVADVLSSGFALTCIFLGVYLILITILVAALRRRNE